MKPVYEQDGITLYLGDCREVLPTLEPGSVDLVLTDPPYADQTHDGARTGDGDEKLVTFAAIPFSDLREILGLCGTACRKWLVATMDWRHTSRFEAETPDNLRFVRFGVWVKPNGAPQFTGDRPGTGWEAVGILHGIEGKLSWNGGGHHAVWICDKQNGQHPTQKPLKLVKEMVRQFSNSGDLILDPFAGSGTTLVAAKQMGRRAIGIEQSADYCEIAIRRLQQKVLQFTD